MENSFNEVLLLKFGEVVLKGLNRQYFEGIMIKDAVSRLKKLGKYKVESIQSVLYVTPLDTDAADNLHGIPRTLYLLGSRYGRWNHFRLYHRFPNVVSYNRFVDFRRLLLFHLQSLQKKLPLCGILSHHGRFQASLTSLTLSSCPKLQANLIARSLKKTGSLFCSRKLVENGRIS